MKLPLILAALVAAGAAFLLTVVPGCERPIPPPIPPGPVNCREACVHLRELRCPVANPTPAGVSCNGVCENVNGSGFVEWDLPCIMQAPSCAAADRCVR